MVLPSDIYSLSDFQRNTRTHIKRLRKTGRPEILTVNGRAEVVIQDAKAYEEMMAAVERAEAIEGIRRGLEDVKNGRVTSFEDFVKELKEEARL